MFVWRGRFGLLLAVILLAVPTLAQTSDPFGAWIALPDENQLIYLDANGVAFHPGTPEMAAACAGSDALVCSKEPLAHVLKMMGFAGWGNAIGLAAALALPSVVLMMIYGQTRIFFTIVARQPREGAAQDEGERRADDPAEGGDRARAGEVRRQQEEARADHVVGDHEGRQQRSDLARARCRAVQVVRPAGPRGTAAPAAALRHLPAR